MDGATGLVRFGVRDYDAQVGRWTSRDPIGFSGGEVNLFAYVGNDPVNALDPSGLAFGPLVPSGFPAAGVPGAALADKAERSLDCIQRILRTNWDTSIRRGCPMR